MPNIIEITDFSDPQLDIFARLTESQLRSKQQPQKSMFIAESCKVIRLALDAGYRTFSLLMEKRHIDGQAADIIARCGDIPIYTADRQLLSELTGYQLTRGVLCAMGRRPLPEAKPLCAQAKRIAVLEDIADSTNVGAIMRSAAALGIDAVLLTSGCCDPLCRRAIRVSMGTVFQIPWARLGNKGAWPGQWLDMLKQMGFATAAMALGDHSQSIDSTAASSEEKLAIILGTEGDGLKKETIAHCDYTLVIPMANGVDSLNVAAASAVAFWQLRLR